MSKNKITQEKLKERLSYNKEAGVFIWKERKKSDFVNNGYWRTWNAKYAGRVCGYIHQLGYIRIKIDEKQYLAHRLAWLYVYGKFPKDDIDHINHDRADNRICNIREATRHENLKNKTLQKNNTSGINGVSPHKGKCRSTIKHNGNQLELGCFDDFFEACCARKSAEIKYGYHPNHGINL